MMSFELNDDVLYTSAMPSGARLFGALSETSQEPTSFGRQSIINTVAAAFAAVAMSGSASDLGSGTLPLGRLHSHLANISNILAPQTNQVIAFNGSAFVATNVTDALVGGLVASNNLSDLLSVGTARTNLDVYSTAEVDAIVAAASIPDGDKGDITVSASGTVWTIDAGAVTTSKLGGDITLAGKALLDDADAGAQRTTLGLAIGTHVQAWDAQLDSLSSASANGVSLVTAADYGAMRALLDLEAGTDFYSISAANSAISTAISGLSSVYQPLDADLTALASATTTRGDLIKRGASANERLGIGTSGYLLGSDGTDPAWVAFTQSGTGAVARSWQDELRDGWVKPRQFWLAIDADDTLSIQRAVNTGKHVILEKKTYLISSAITVTVSGTTITGSGRDATSIYQDTLNAMIFDVSANNVTISHMALDYDGTPTLGAIAINATGSNFEASSFQISRAHVGVLCASPIQYIHHFHLYNYVSAGVKVWDAGDVTISHFIINAISSTNGADGGIQLLDFAEAIMISHGDVLNGVYSMTTGASVYASGSRPAYNTFTDVYFDTATNGVLLDKIVDTEFIGCWFSGGRAGAGNPGCTIATTANVHFTTTRFNNCGSNGAYVAVASIGTKFVCCKFLGNGQTAGSGVADGLYFEPNTSGFSVIGCTSSNLLFIGVQRYGVYVAAGTSDNYTIALNDLRSNATGALFDGGSGADKYISKNLGYAYESHRGLVWDHTSSGVSALTTGDLRVSTAGTNAASVVTVGGSQTLTSKVLTSPTITTGITPTSNDGAALGSTSLKFSDLYLASGSVINFDSGDVTITHSANRLDIAGGTVYVISGGDLYLDNVFHAASSTGTTAGGSPVAGVTLGSANIGLYWGSGAPTISAPQGSVYFRTDGGASTRIYSNNDGSTGWSAITSA